MRFLPSLSLSPSLPPGPDDGAAAAAAINRLLTPSFPQSSLCVPLTKSRKTKELSSIILHRLKSCGMKLHTAGTIAEAPKPSKPIQRSAALWSKLLKL